MQLETHDDRKVSDSNPLPIKMPALPTGKSATDRSGTITSGGNAQNAMAANTARAGWSLVNNSDTPMTVNPAGTASATAGIPVFPDDVVEGNETNAISVFCASTGKAFTAWEY